jgi:hypothetical protein
MLGAWNMDLQFKRVAAQAIIVLSLSLAGKAMAQTGPASPLAPERFAVGLTAGSDGIGGDVQYSVNRYLVLRGRGTWLEATYSGNSSSLHYSGRFDLSEGGGFVDIHPFANAFTLSVGAVSGPRRVDLSAAYRTGITYQGQTYTSAQLGTVGGAATLAPTAPFVGLGFDNTFTTRSRIGFKLLAGVAFSRQLQVELHPTSGLATVYPQIIEPELVQTEQEIRKDGDILATYPQVSAGLTFKF